MNFSRESVPCSVSMRNSWAFDEWLTCRVELWSYSLVKLSTCATLSRCSTMITFETNTHIGWGCNVFEICKNILVSIWFLEDFWTRDVGSLICQLLPTVLLKISDPGVSVFFGSPGSSLSFTFAPNSISSWRKKASEVAYLVSSSEQCMDFWFSKVPQMNCSMVWRRWIWRNQRILYAWSARFWCQWARHLCYFVCDYCTHFNFYS